MECKIIDLLLSITLGIVLAIILYGFFNKPVQYRGPNSRDIVNKEFKLNDKTYKLEPFVL